KLLPQHGRTVEPDADRAPAHRRVLFRGMREVGEHLVATDIERAEYDRAAVGLLISAAVKLGLVRDIRKRMPRQQRDLGAKQPNALSTCCLQLGQIEQESRIEQQTHGNTIAG